MEHWFQRKVGKLSVRARAAGQRDVLSAALRNARNILYIAAATNVLIILHVNNKTGCLNVVWTNFQAVQLIHKL